MRKLNRTKPPRTTTNVAGRRSAVSLAVLIVLTLAFALVCVYYLIKASNPLKKPIGYWIALDFNNQNPPPQVVVFADSQLGGLRSADAKVFGNKLDFVFDHRSYAVEKALRESGNGDMRVFVASQPGTLVSDCFIMARSLFTRKNKPKVVILALNPRAFLRNGLKCPGDSDYFRVFAPHAALSKDEQQMAYPQFWYRPVIAFKDAFALRLAKAVPGEFQFLPDDQQSYHDLKPLYPPRFTFDLKQCQHQIWFLSETLKYLRSENIEALVIAMPLEKSKSIEALAQLSEKLVAPIQNECIKNGARFLDLTNDIRFTRTDFIDPVHLSQKGGERFASVLSQYITQTRTHDTDNALESQSSGRKEWVRQ